MTDPPADPRAARATTIACAAFAGVALALAAMQPISNADTFGHLAQGRAIEAVGLYVDPFTCAGRFALGPATNYEWLSDWLTWSVYRALGWNGLVACAMLLAGASGAGLVGLAARRVGPRAAWLASLFLVLAIPAVQFRLSARPHLIALPFAVLYLVVLTSERAFADRRRALRTVGLLALAHVLWTNLHGSHLLGLAIAGASTIAAWPDRRRVAWTASTVAALAAASCVSPYAHRILVDALLHTLDPAYRAVVSEWQSLLTLGLSWTTVHAAVQCALLALAAPRVLRRTSHRVALRTWLGISVVLAIAALRSLRFVEELLLLSSPLLGIVLADALGERLSLRPAPIALSLATSLAIAAAGIAVNRSELHLFEGGADLRFVPAEASEHIDRELGEVCVLGSMPSSWYLDFAAPEARVVVDGRVPFYGPAHVQATTDALSRPDALAAMLARARPDAVLVQHTATDETGAIRELARDPRFVRTWVDGSYAVYVTREVVTRRAIDPTRVDALPVAYDAGVILGASDREADAMREDVAHLGEGPDAHALASFVRAMLRLRPLARFGGWAGYRAPASDDERRAAEIAHAELRVTRARVGRVPIVIAQAALVALLACELEEARALLEDARRDGDVRETIFGEAELALREGRDDDVRALLDQARMVPGASEDPWVRSLARALSDRARGGCEAR